MPPAKKKKKTGKRVVFRCDEYGVYALFPDDIVTSHGACLCYVLVGKHCAADYEHCIRTSTLATRKQYEPILKELRRLGYNLRVVKRR